MATRPDMRIGDADREATVASLREHYATGRLSLEEFNQRLDAVSTRSPAISPTSEPRLCRFP
jgi:Domain of unknown function (DUF1707)